MSISSLSCRFKIIRHSIKSSQNKIRRTYATQTNERDRLDVLAKDFNFTQLNDWYKLSAKVISNQIFHNFN